ncbi:unnamed protein product [Mytilus coruscus]|uniref:Uncharacterized protein n=1 Tax=Mytilus coruscus TaxID=42192 RepID=A0A6J8B6U3_MYTCO|nr:unnamed protein product [Mytilus coruscus]
MIIVGYRKDNHLYTDKAKIIEECFPILSKSCNDSLIDSNFTISDHPLQIVDIYQKESNEISGSFDPSTENEKANKEVWSFFNDDFYFQRVDYCEILDHQHQNDQNTIEKTVFRYSEDDDLSVVPSMVIVGSIENVSDTVILKEYEATVDQPKVIDWKTKGQISSGRLSKDSLKDWKANTTKSGKRITLAAHKVETKDCFVGDYCSRLLLAPEMTMLLLVMWIHVTSVFSKISVRNTKEKHHVSNQVNLKCQLCVDKNRATSRVKKAIVESETEVFKLIKHRQTDREMIVLPTCFKRRHSLKGVRLVAAIKRIRGGQPQSLKEFARFQKDKILNDLSMDDLRQQVLDLTGEELQDLLQFADRDDTVEEARQPSGQDLTQSQDQTPTTSGNSVNVQRSDDNVQSSGDNVQSSGDNNNGTNKRKRDDLEDRIASLENTTKEDVVKNLKEKNSKTLGSLNSFNIHVPEWEMGKCFNPKKVQVCQEPAWVALGDEIPSLTTHVPSAEEVLNGACGVHFDSGTLPLRDPDLFLSSQIHHHLSNWKDILEGTDNKDILKWLINGIDATDFFRHFKGNFKGRFYDSDISPNQYFQNLKICKQHVDFISKELCEKIAMGSVKLLGAVGECKIARVIQCKINKILMHEFCDSL